MAVPLSLFDASDSQLAMELAAKLSPTAEIIARYHISKAEFRLKIKSPTFRKMYQQAKSFWSSDANANQRIRVKSQMLLEDSLLVLYQMVHDPETSPSIKLDATNQLAVLSDAKPRREADTRGDTGGGFTLTLNLGGKALEINAPALKDVDGEVVEAAVTDGAI